MKLRQWQEKAFPLWWAKKRGIVKVVTGGGKTVFAIHCLTKYLKEQKDNSIFIIVPSIALLDQWYEGLQKTFGDKDISLNGRGEHLENISKITISTIDSVKNIIHKFNAPNTLLIVDECHKIGTEKRGEILTGNWHATLGLSATPERDYDDNFYIIIKKILGDIIFDYDYIDAREDEVIVNFKLLYAYAEMTEAENDKYKDFTKKIQRRAATIGGNNMNDYPLATDADNSPHLLIPETQSAMLHCVAANDDEADPVAKDTLSSAYAAAGLSAEIEVYTGTLHGWCPPESQVYDETQAERAWSRLLALFEIALA